MERERVGSRLEWYAAQRGCRVLTSEDVLDSVRDDEVLVGDEAVDRLLVTLRHGGLRRSCTRNFSNYRQEGKEDTKLASTRSLIPICDPLAGKEAMA